MADTKVSALTENTAPVAADLLHHVDDPAGTPTSKKVTAENLITKAHGLSDGTVSVSSGAMTTSTTVSATQIQGTDVDATELGSPSDGDILVYRSAGTDFVLEAKPAAGSNPAAADITDATADGIALITSADANPFTDADESKLDAIEASADVTDATNVTAAGALMDSEVTNLADVKAFDTTDYATAAQGTLADSALQPADVSDTVYGVGWNGDTGAASKNAIYDKIETISGGGGGNPYNADLVVASSGGDYTTLGEAVANASAGDVIYIEPGTHTETADRSSTVQVHVIGTRASIVVMGAYDITFGAESVVEGFTLHKTGVGYLTNTAENVHYKDLRIEITASDNYSIYPQGAYSSIENCFIYSTSTPGAILYANGDYTRINNCTIDVSTGTSQGLIRVNGFYSNINGCVVSQSGTTGGSIAIYLDEYCSAAGNMVKGGDHGIFMSDTGATCTGNTVYSVSSSFGINGNGTLVTITGNTVYTESGIGIELDGFGSTCTGNTLYGSGSGTGIAVASGTDKCVISGNNVNTQTTGINVTASNCDYTTIVGNILHTNTTDISDTGTNTFKATATDSDPLNNIIP